MTSASSCPCSCDADWCLRLDGVSPSSFQARHEPTGWRENTTFDDSSWHPAVYVYSIITLGLFVRHSSSPVCFFTPQHTKRCWHCRAYSPWYLVAPVRRRHARFGGFRVISTPSLSKAQLIPRMAGAAVEVTPAVPPIRTTAIAATQKSFVEWKQEFTGGLRLTVADGKAGQVVRFRSGERCMFDLVGPDLAPRRCIHDATDRMPRDRACLGAHVTVV